MLWEVGTQWSSVSSSKGAARHHEEDMAANGALKLDAFLICVCSCMSYWTSNYLFYALLNLEQFMYYCHALFLLSIWTYPFEWLWFMSCTRPYLRVCAVCYCIKFVLCYRKKILLSLYGHLRFPGAFLEYLFYVYCYKFICSQISFLSHVAMQFQSLSSKYDLVLKSERHFKDQFTGQPKSWIRIRVISFSSIDLEFRPIQYGALQWRHPNEA